ncbi:phosphatase PAP2 family protein [Streptomyces sp. NPDC004726]
MQPPGSAPPTPPVPVCRPRPRLPSGPARAGMVLTVLSAVLLVLVVLSWSPLVSFDRSVAQALHHRAVVEPGLVRVNRILTDWVWDPWTMRALVGAVVCLLWWRREWLLGSWLAGTLVLGTVVQQSVKYAVGRERPRWPDPVDTAHFSAFPSGHVLTAMVACGLLLWLLRRRGTTGRAWSWSVAVAAVSVVGVGWTRMYLGVHWPTDVLGGWLMGGALVAFSIACYPWAERTWGRPAVPGSRPTGGQSR